MKKPKAKDGAVHKKDEMPKVPAKVRAVAAAGDSDAEDRIEAAIANRYKKIEKPLFARDEEVTTTSVMAKLTEVLAARGRKGTSSADQMALLVRLREVGLHSASYD